ncbi:MAG TPA: bifunctional riboflavin kinase/FAD synthetase [Steroidobacteraceae bacterium]|nr:bifunctional riboflavin kinase/FAD synthetase [Steroidobacteraceae bacterium]
MLIRRGFKPCTDADPGRAIAIGNFDGLHLGHQAILADLRARGRESRLPTAVLCFEPQPKEYFAPEAAPARLMRLRDKAEGIGQAGIDELRVLRFDAALAGLEADAFIERVLIGALRARQVVIGEGFRFGRGRGGDVASLRRAGDAYGFAVTALPATEVGAAAVSSTRVRESIAAGRLDEAKELLGRDYRISGHVIAGQKLGRTLGFRTANIRLHRRVSPVAGIFAVRASGAGLDRHPGVASVGTRPTVGGTEWLLEVHLFDFGGELYHERLEVDFIARLRDEVRFPDLASMTAQMHEDERLARKLLVA